MTGVYRIVDGENTRDVTRDELVSYLHDCQVHGIVIDRSSARITIDFICRGGREVVRLDETQIPGLRPHLPDPFLDLLEKHDLL